MDEIRLSTITVDLRTRAVRGTDPDDPERSLSALEAALLACLAEHAGRDVSREELLERVWRGSADASLRTVDFAIRRLRRKLGNPPELLTSHGVGYRLAPGAEDGEARVGRPPILVETGEIDLDRRTFTTRDGGVHLLGRPECDLLEALASGVPQEREELERAVWGLGRHGAAMTATVSRLRAKLEAGPGEPRVLRTEGSRLRLGVVPSDRTNLGPPAFFVDRPEVGLTLDALRRARLVTVVGAAGIGKTRLARRVARAWLAAHPAAGAWFCDLASASEGADMTDALSRALRVSPGPDPEGALQSALSALPPDTVVVLDDLERLVDQRELVAGWGDAAPQARLLATSRVALGLDGEVVIEARPLTDASGAELFRSIAGERHDAATVEALVRRLDGLPLAIELAAARASRIPPAELLERWAERLDLLIHPPPGARSRHSTLRGALDGSWELLSPAERAALARLGVFEGAFPLERAVAMVGAGSEEIIERLVAAALLHRTDDGRLRMYDAIRAYAREKRVLAGDEAAVERHVRIHLDEAARPIEGMDPEGSERLRAMADELRAIWRRPLDDLDRARAAVALGALYEMEGSPARSDEVYRAGLPGAPAALAWRMLAGRARWMQLTGDRDEALKLVRQAYEVASAVDRASTAAVGLQVANLLRWCGRYAEAEAEAERALAAYDALGRDADVAAALGLLGQIAIERGEPEVARERHRRARALGSPLLAQFEMSLVELYVLCGELDQAEALGEECAARWAVYSEVHRARHRLSTIRIRCARGRLAGLDEELVAVGRDFQRLGQRGWQQACQLARVWLAIRCGDLDRAESLLDPPTDGWRMRHAAALVGAVLAALRGAPADGWRRLAAIAESSPIHAMGTAPVSLLAWQAVLHLGEGRIDEAEAAYGAARARARGTPDDQPPRPSTVLVGLVGGLVDSARGRVDDARAALRWARDRRSADGYRLVETGDELFAACSLLERSCRAAAVDRGRAARAADGGPPSP